MPRFLLFVFFLSFAVLPAFASETPVYKVEAPAGKLYTGEVLVYQIRYLGIPVGEGRAEIREKINVRGRDAWHIVTTVHSYRAIDFIYKVRDEHHTWIDIEKICSLGLTKRVREGRRKRDEKTEYDVEKLTAVRDAGGDKKVFPVPEGTQDQMSCGYWFRTVDVKPGTSVRVPVEAGGKNHEMEVKIYGTKKILIEGVGEFEAVEAEPVMPFEGIFIRKGAIRGWMSLDKRRIPLRMTVKIPVLGTVAAELKSYTPGKENE